MRTKTTNFLQITVVLTALVYSIAGMIFFVSPFVFGKLLSIPTSDEWLRQISADGFLVMIYLIARGLSALMVITGVSLVMPLFDPLKYRLLIHLLCVIFPFVSCAFLLYAGFYDGYMIARIIGGIFGLIFLLNFISLHMTRKNAKQGIE
jgi:hypothetical protein